jgi:hypothetical protein
MTLNLYKTKKIKNHKIKTYLKNICFDPNFNKSLENLNIKRKSSINFTALEIVNNKFFSMNFKNVYVERFSKCKDSIISFKFKYLLNIIGDINSNAELNSKILNKFLENNVFNSQEIITRSYLMTNKITSNISKN